MECFFVAGKHAVMGLKSDGSLVWSTAFADGFSLTMSGGIGLDPNGRWLCLPILSNSTSAIAVFNQQSGKLSQMFLLPPFASESLSWFDIMTPSLTVTPSGTTLFAGVSFMRNSDGFPSGYLFSATL